MSPRALYGTGRQRALGAVRERVRLAVVVLAAFAAFGIVACGGGGGDKRPHARVAGHLVATGTHGRTPQALSAGPSDDYRPTGQIVADNGFRPGKDGFSFPNYDGSSGAVNLTPAAMEELYGPDVCASGVGSSCLLTPAAAQALLQLDGQLEGGHCYGFSVAALRFFKHVLNPSNFMGPTVPALPLQGNDALQSEIAASFITQFFPSVTDAVVHGTPRHVLEALVASLRAGGDAYTLAFRKRDFSGGHAITPYAVEDRGNGRFAILVYDNNHPLKTRPFLVDTNADTWSYEAAISPSYEESHYEGDASTGTLELHSLTSGLGPQPCAFCGSSNPTGGPGATGSGRPSKPEQQIALVGDPSNHGHLLITDPRGRRTGYVDGRLVNEIPGARALFPLADQNWRLHPEPLYRIPAGVKISVTVLGGSLAHAAVENVSVVAPGASAAVDGVRIGPGQRAQLSFGRALSSVKYQAGSTVGAAPIVRLGRETGGADFSVSLKAPVLKGAPALSVALDPVSKRVTVKTPARAPAAGYGLSLARYSALGRQDFAHGGLSLPPASSSQLHFQTFNRSGESLPFSTTSAAGRRSRTLSG